MLRCSSEAALVHRAGDEMHIVDADADPHHKGARPSSARIRAARPPRSGRPARSMAMHRPRCQRQALAHPRPARNGEGAEWSSRIEMTMLRKLIDDRRHLCTTCSNSGRNRVTEVCVIPCSARIHSASPIGALSDRALRGNRLSAARRSSRKVRPTSATAAAIKQDAQRDPRHRSAGRDAQHAGGQAFRTAETALRRSGCVRPRG